MRAGSGPKKAPRPPAGHWAGSLSTLVGEEDAFTPSGASPLTLRSVTTYRGLNAQRQHVFETQTTFQAWAYEVRLGGEDGQTFRAELLPQSSRTGGTFLIRPDGLLASSTDTQVLRRRVTQQTTLRGR